MTGVAFLGVSGTVEEGERRNHQRKRCYRAGLTKSQEGKCAEMHFEVAVVISAECVAGEADPLFFFLPLLFFLCLVSGDGEACGGGAGRPDSHSGPGTRPAHLPEQRGPRHPRRLGGSLAPRPAALPASQWPPAQPPAQRQHAQLPERWVRRSRRSQPPDSLDGTFSPHRVTL